MAPGEYGVMLGKLRHWYAFVNHHRHGWADGRAFQRALAPLRMRCFENGVIVCRSAPTLTQWIDSKATAPSSA